MFCPEILGSIFNIINKSGATYTKFSTYIAKYLLYSSIYFVINSAKKIYKIKGLDFTVVFNIVIILVVLLDKDSLSWLDAGRIRLLFPECFSQGPLGHLSIPKRT